MEVVLGCLAGIFVGYTTCALFAIDKMNEKDRKIANQKVMIKNRDEALDNVIREREKYKNLYYKETQKELADDYQSQN